MKRIVPILLLVLLGCVSDDLYDCYDPRKKNPAAACPEILLPVCGCDGITYPNACFAENAGLRQWTEGNCPP